MSAEVVRVALECRDGAWSLDISAPARCRVTRQTRLVLVNSPNNPTGWTMPHRDWDALLAHCRRHGVWLVTDDAYERLVFDGAAHAPGVLASMSDEDRYQRQHVLEELDDDRLAAWLARRSAPLHRADRQGDRVQHSCAPGFVQQAGLVACATVTR